MTASMTMVNFLGLSASLWLGLYLVTRSPRSRLAWLTAATLWCLCLSFVSSQIYIMSSTEARFLPWWLGWSVVLAAPLWFHLSWHLRDARMTRGQRVCTIIVYAMTLNVMGAMMYTDWVLGRGTSSSPLYYGAHVAGPLFPLLALLLVVVPAAALVNLYIGWSRSGHPSLRNQRSVLIGATALALCAGLYATSTIWLQLDAPVLVNNAGLMVAVVFLGYGVARYNALIEGRSIQRDFPYTALAAALVTALYLLAALATNLVFHVSLTAFIFVIMLAIVSHSLYDWGRIRLDRALHRLHYGDLRARLYHFADTSAQQGDLADRLQTILEALCRTLTASGGLLVVKEDKGFVAIAGWRMETGQIVEQEDIAIESTRVHYPGEAIAGLSDTIVRAPLRAGGERLGAILLGPKASAARYSDEDLEMLEECARTVGSVVLAHQLQQCGVARLSALLQEVSEREQALRDQMRQLLTEMAPPRLSGRNEREAVPLVEEVLRRLYDYPYLGTHSLACLSVVSEHLKVPSGSAITHLDRGKALQNTLLEAIDKLKPPGSRPSPARREWYHFIVLHDCYVVGKPNRDVMGDLFIGEGTFNRTRRQAIRAVTRALAEMDRAARRGAT